MMVCHQSISGSNFILLPLKKLPKKVLTFQNNIVLSGRGWLDETYYSVMMRDCATNEDGSLPRGLSRNKICIGVATDKNCTFIKAEGYGKPFQKMSYETFSGHIKEGSTLVNDKEGTHKKLVSSLSLVSEEYSSKELKGLEDMDNPLDPVNHLHYLIKRFLYAHGGFNRSEIQGVLKPLCVRTQPALRQAGKDGQAAEFSFSKSQIAPFP